MTDVCVCVICLLVNLLQYEYTFCPDSTPRAGTIGAAILQLEPRIADLYVQWVSEAELPELSQIAQVDGTLRQLEEERTEVMGSLGEVHSSCCFIDLIDSGMLMVIRRKPEDFPMRIEIMKAMIEEAEGQDLDSFLESSLTEV
eukprot:Gregarina_sp_Poly_1__6727@NODE_361_length_9223_cov_159_738751_g298_i0_p5_GENE_NODE_361_length_9223_cov_159_738751_g298_i0NODE_361_length_9223_cov_159_738751_g298_i0_p5_ORF_typecomplete_len143_score24_89_NODE_361_length_9223_cov_159_738751_g298_i076748102